METFYFRDTNYYICDLELCEKSERTFDMSLYDLANNKELLDLLKLYYIIGNYGQEYNYKSRAEWFCGYLASFYETNKSRYNKMLTNPRVRLLIQDSNLLKEVKKIFNEYK